jgi:hypothetical protein
MENLTPIGPKSRKTSQFLSKKANDHDFKGMSSIPVRIYHQNVHKRA